MAADEETRIVFHLTNADQTVAGELHSTRSGGMLVAYAGRRSSTVAGRGRQPQRRTRTCCANHCHSTKAASTSSPMRFSNLTFVACRNTIDRLRVERGIEVKLILTPSDRVGVSHVVKRQQGLVVYPRLPPFCGSPQRTAAEQRSGERK